MGVRHTCTASYSTDVHSVCTCMQRRAALAHQARRCNIHIRLYHISGYITGYTPICLHVYAGPHSLINPGLDVQLPLECPLHSHRDVYQDCVCNVGYTVRGEGGGWCMPGVCGGHPERTLIRTLTLSVRCFFFVRRTYGTHTDSYAYSKCALRHAH